MWARDLLAPWHLVVLLAIVLILFGPSRLPELGRSIGEGMRAFRSATSGETGEPSGSVPGTTSAPAASSPAGPAGPAARSDPPAEAGDERKQGGM
ncbi:MAG: twin-arginine translocase TatA/TatE family subunit [Bacillota bacterium]|nr:twin-arginine translocase TatA/TatE family subunit [Bacillota bacterium]